MTAQSEMIALIDMDGTLVDYDAAMWAALEPLCSPEEIQAFEADPCSFHALEDRHDYMKARMDLIKASSGWWRRMPRIERNFEVVEMLRDRGFDLYILTKGPWLATNAWTEKVDWCRVEIPDAEIHITGATTGKGMVYGKVLFDDHPPYIESWLRWRPRGLVIVPAQPWNEGFEHPNAVRWDGSAAARAEIAARLDAIVASMAE